MTLGPEGVWLGDGSGIPIDRPFTRAQARDRGVDPRRLARWVQDGLLIRPIRGVYHAAQLRDSLDLRVQCLKLVVPPDAVVCDRTAGWLLGAEMVLAPGDHLVVPKVSLYLPEGRHLRSKLVDSGERTLAARDIKDVDGLLVTTELRTACDLGRLLHRDQAFGAMDSMMRVGGFSVDELERESRRFRGYRGIIQARCLMPWVDGRSQSGPESTLRLRWLTCRTLPRPDLQVEVKGPVGSYFLDLAVPELKYAAEYDGVEWHGPDQREHDRKRRAWVREQYGYIIDVFVSANIHGREQDTEEHLQDGIARARRRRGEHG